MKRLVPWLLALVLLAAGLPVQAQTPTTAALLAEMKQGGYVIVFRHGATNRDQADTDPLNHDNIARQRLLSPAGKDIAQKVGESLRKLGIALGPVYTSKFNRAVETGRLVSGSDSAVITTLDITEGGLVVTPIENDRRAEAFRKLVATPTPPGKNVLIVSHKPNIIDAFGKDWFEVKEGEASVFKPDGAGKAVLVGRLQAADWIKAAGGN